MNKFELLLEKICYAGFAVCFSFVCLYVPGGWHKVEVAEAGGVGGIGNASEIVQIANNIQLGFVNAATSISAGADTVTAAMTTSNFVLDNVLDGIAWSLAKSVVSQMTSSIVNWINSGFKGSPAFISDMKGFLLDIADKELGKYLEELGGPFSFVCSPFKLDVRMALAVTYDKARSQGQTPSTCTLTGALANIDKFIDGTEKFVDGGGWASWFKMTTEPTKYTPTGNILAAQAEVSARLVNARGEEVKLLDFGGGFLSSKICETVHGAGTKRENCFITTPGKVIQEALTFQTSTGARTLIEADEINEIVSALFAQIGKQAITGAAGLLGLTGGTGYTSSPVPFTQQLSEASAGADPEQMRNLIEDSLAIDLEYRNLALSYRPWLLAYEGDITNNAERRADAGDAAADIPPLIAEINNNIITLNGLIADFAAVDMAMTPTEKQAILQEITTDYFAIATLHSEVELNGKESYWESLLR